MALTNEQAKLLFGLEKETELQSYKLPNPNEILTISLSAKDERFKDELFSLDISRKSLSLKKKTFQKRAQENIVLRRLDFFGGHHNPTLSFVPNNLENSIIELMQKYTDVRFSNQTHIHFYIDGYGEKWAFPITEFDFIESDDIFEQTKEFCRYCNIAGLPTFNMKDLLCMI
ncbi:hypothetical protein [Sulfurimonas sp.]|jgi:hypothetical protein|uniref:DUF6978 family protein n=1 Tax=Sulfurimonas sp. TaxID=2022749 RepID=UPI0025ECD9D7|nr:hypothetical protein [Sulfurimonas sp.]MCK9474268.1 hypothetical protein [Sulfurimonas sp.]MDD3506733.1 hypothetical protein [Sulfurimonas sp.]